MGRKMRIRRKQNQADLRVPPQQTINGMSLSIPPLHCTHFFIKLAQPEIKQTKQYTYSLSPARQSNFLDHEYP